MCALHVPSPILVDLDDVLSCTTEAASIWHNRQFHTKLQLDDFHYYHWWKNPGWGSIEQTEIKADSFYRSEEFRNVRPIQGANEVLQKLKYSGLRFAILTSRDPQELKALTEAWLDQWYPDIFEAVYFSQDFTQQKSGDRAINSIDTETETASSGVTKLSKAETCKHLQAKVLIDDALENVWDCAAAGVPALLFGDYDWGKRLSSAEKSQDLLSFEERNEYEINQGAGVEWWLNDNTAVLSEGIWKVKDWQEVLEWVLEGPGKHIL